MLFLLNGLHFFDYNIWVSPRLLGGERQYCNFNKPNLDKKPIYRLHEFLNSRSGFAPGLRAQRGAAFSTGEDQKDSVQITSVHEERCDQ